MTKCYHVMTARVVELVDTQDLGSCAARCGGSSPPSRTRTGLYSFIFPSYLLLIA